MPHLAFLCLQSVTDWRTAPEVRTVLVTGLVSMAEVAAWDQGIKDNNLDERYAFAYDVLVAEAQGAIDAWFNGEVSW
jgi:hypothetical protein